MAFTAYRTWVAGEIVTAAMLNQQIRDNGRYMHGDDGIPTILSGLTIDNTDGDERLLLPLLSTAECSTVLNAEGEVAFDEQTHQMKEYDGTAVRALISEADVDDTPVNGATTVPISSNWAYDFINTLTTQADLPYATAAGVWTRLAKGTQYQYLRMNAGATAPEWTNLASTLASTLITATRDDAAASGDVSYTGAGFQPTAVICFAICAGAGQQFSLGMADDSLAEMCVYQRIDAPGYLLPETTLFINVLASVGNGQSAVLKTLDVDGFTLTWTKAGTPNANDITLIFLCLR